MGRELVRSLEGAGFTLTRNPSDADIIFAHSGGCFLVPADTAARLVFMVGLPYWPGRPLLASAGIKVWRDWKLNRQRHTIRQWARKCVFHVRYALKFKDTIRMAINRSTHNSSSSNRHRIIVRNHYDAYCTPHVQHAIGNSCRTFVALPGEHDDCWDNPERYLELIQSQL
jgi:hypothetical protein